MMKRVILFGSLLVSAGFSQELPDFREYLKNTGFYSITVDERRTITGQYLRTQYYRPLPAFYVVGAYDNRYCPQNGLRVFTRVISQGIETEQEYDAKASLLKQTFSKFPFEGEGYCKNDKGEVVIEYKMYGVVHPPSKVFHDRLHYTLEELIEKYKNASLEEIATAFGSGLFKKSPIKIGVDTYRLENLYNTALPVFTAEPKDLYILWKNCEAGQGQFYRVGKEGLIPFREYLWYVATGGGGFRTYKKTSPFFNPEEAGAVSASNADSLARAMAGMYVCKGGQREFTYSLSDGRPTSGILKIGVDEKAIARATQKAQIEEHNTMARAGLTDELSFLALSTAKAKAPVSIQRGGLIYKGLYNGEQGGCSLVSVQVVSGGALQATHNYRVCGERVEYIGETGLPALPKGIETIKLDVARACQRFGQMQMVYEGTTIQCRALRDKDKCLVELTYLQEGKLVGKEELNGCR